MYTLITKDGPITITRTRHEVDRFDLLGLEHVQLTDQSIVKQLIASMKVDRAEELKEIRKKENVARQRHISRMLSNEGRAAIAAEMVEPIRRSLDYQGIGRRILMVEPLPERILTPTFNVTTDQNIQINSETSRASGFYTPFSTVRISTTNALAENARQDMMTEEDINIIASIAATTSITLERPIDSVTGLDINRTP